MREILIICLLLLLHSGSAWCQNDTVTEPEHNESDFAAIAWHSTSLIMKYYQAHDADSALLVLNDWQTACGPSEPITRTRILLAISDRAFEESIYDSTIVDDVLNYMRRIESTNAEKLYRNYESYFGYIPLRGDYDFFTQSIADSLLKGEFDTPLELLFCQFYANIVSDPLKEIKSNTLYDNTALKSYYMQVAQKSLSKPDYHVGLFAGTWIPTGNASLLGVHPEIGMQVGIKYLKMTYNFTLAFKFLKSANDYAIYMDGNIDTTNYFLGGYLGLDIERELFKTNKNEFDLLFGIGYDGFESVKTIENNSEASLTHPINSINTNFGLGFRHFYKKNRYWGLKAKYNILNYNNSGGTNLMGNCITISLCLGNFSNQAKENELYEIRY